MFNKLYQKSLELAAHKSSKFFLAIVAFAESSFFPVPPDIMVVPMVIAKKKRLYKNISHSYNLFCNWWFARIFYWFNFFRFCYECS